MKKDQAITIEENIRIFEFSTRFYLLEKLLRDPSYSPTIYDRVEIVKYFSRQDYSFLPQILANIVSLLDSKAGIVFGAQPTIKSFSLEDINRASYDIQNIITKALEVALREDNQSTIDVLSPVALFGLDFEGVTETLLDAEHVPKEVKDMILSSYNENFLQKFNRFYDDFDEDIISSRIANIYESLGYIDNELFFWPMGAEFPHKSFLDEFKKGDQGLSVKYNVIIKIIDIWSNMLDEFKGMKIDSLYGALQRKRFVTLGEVDGLVKVEYILHELAEMEEVLGLFYNDIYSFFKKKVEDKNYITFPAINQIKFLSKTQVEMLLGSLKNNFPEIVDANAKLFIKKLTFQFLQLEDGSMDERFLEKTWQKLESKQNFQYLDVADFIGMYLTEVDEFQVEMKESSSDLAVIDNFVPGELVSDHFIEEDKVEIVPYPLLSLEDLNQETKQNHLQITIYNENPGFIISDYSYAIAGNVVGRGIVNPAIECLKDTKIYDSWWECYSSNFDLEGVVDAIAPTAISALNQIAYPSSIPLLVIINNNLLVEIYRYYNNGIIPSVLNAGVSTIFAVVSNIFLNIALNANEDVLEFHKDHPFTSALLLTVMIKQGLALPGYIYNEAVSYFNDLEMSGEVPTHEEF